MSGPEQRPGAPGNTGPRDRGPNPTPPPGPARTTPVPPPAQPGPQPARSTRPPRAARDGGPPAPPTPPSPPSPPSPPPAIPSLGTPAPAAPAPGTPERGTPGRGTERTGATDRGTPERTDTPARAARPDRTGAQDPTGTQDRSGPQDRSERSERARRADRTSGAGRRADRIDEKLTRLTAAHAGLTLQPRDGDGADGDGTPPGRWPRPTPARLVAAALATVVLLAATIGWGAKGWLGSSMADAAALEPESGAVVDAEVQQGDENVLYVAGDPAAAPGTRADTVLVAHVPAEGGPVVVVSFPADLEINRPPCDRWDTASSSYQDLTVPAEARTQLITALDIGGPRCITRVMQQLSGLAVTQYVGLDLGAVGALADAAGGIGICSPDPVRDVVLGPVVPDAGATVLDGRRAADYARAGEVPGDLPDDHGRIERQHRLLAGLLERALSVRALLDLGQVADLRPALGAALLTDDAGLDEVLALALSLRSLDADGIVFTGVPITGLTNSRGNAVLRDIDARQLFAAVREDAPLPEPGPERFQVPPAPSEVTVQVLNASERSGLAARVGETLTSLGFEVGEVGNAEVPSPQTVIRFSADRAAGAALLAATVPSAASVPEPSTAGVLQLILGRSFDDVVRAPSEPAVARPDVSGAPAAGCR